MPGDGQQPYHGTAAPVEIPQTSPHPAQEYKDLLQEPAANAVAPPIAAFGFDLHEIDGHDLDAIEAALSAPVVAGKPRCILAHTVKGKGVSYMENQAGWHGKAPNAEQRDQALKELEG